MTKLIAENRRARFDYFLEQTLEVGLALTGTEVKSIRDAKANLKDSYAVVRNNEVWLLDCHIGGYLPGSYLNHPSMRERRLLLHRAEIDQGAGLLRVVFERRSVTGLSFPILAELKVGVAAFPHV